MNVVQPLGTRGEVNLISPLTLENIADAIIEGGLASRDEIEATIAELYRFAPRPQNSNGATARYSGLGASDLLLESPWQTIGQSLGQAEVRRLSPRTRSGPPALAMARLRNLARKARVFFELFDSRLR